MGKCFGRLFFGFYSEVWWVFVLFVFVSVGKIGVFEVGLRFFVVLYV